MTKKEMFNKIMGMVNDQDIKDFCLHEIELLERKASNKTASKTQKENENIKNDIVIALTEIAKPVTISELQTANEKMSAYSNQKLSALLKQLVEIDKKVVKTIDKKKSYFSIAE